MKKVTNLTNENYSNMCGCSSSFDGNEGYGFEKDSDYDNGYNTPRYSNAVGDAGELDIETENDFGVPSNFDNFLNASKRKEKRQARKDARKEKTGSDKVITKKSVADALNKGKVVLDKATEVANAIASADSKPSEVSEKPLDASEIVAEKPQPTKSNKTLLYVGIGAIVLVAVFIGYKKFYGKNKS